MTEQAIAIYCFIDDFFLAVGRKEDAHCNLSGAKLLTTALVAARFFYGNLHSACACIREHHGVRMTDKPGFTRRLHGLQEQLVALFLALGQSLWQLNTCSRYLVDSFPVAVCGNIRIARCRPFRGEGYRGRCVSKRRYFYGFRVQLIATVEGHAPGLTCWQSARGVELRACRKSNSRRADEPHMAFLKDHYRKRIKITFSGITRLFPKRIHAVTPQGFILKLILFSFAYTLNQVLE